MSGPEKEVPKFRTGAQPFATGLTLYPPESEIDWVVPEDWNEKRHGKHFAAHGPSITFMPLNEAAEKLMASHKEVVRKARIPKPSAQDEQFATLHKMHVEMMSALLEQQAMNRKLLEKVLEKDDEEKGKKKGKD